MEQDADVTATKGMPIITDEQYALVKSVGIATGSRAFGLNHKSSDLDFVVSVSDWERLKVIANIGYTYEVEGNFLNVKVNAIGVEPTIDIIITPTEEEKHVWYCSNDLMILMLRSQYSFKLVCADKDTRITIFQAFKDYYRRTNGKSN